MGARFVPEELFVLYQHFVVEEGLSLIRHDLRNKLGSIRNASFYVGRKIQKAAPDLVTADPRVPTFLALIGTELDAAEHILQSKLPRVETGEATPAGAVVQRVRDIVSLPSGIRWTVDVATDARVRISADEAALALVCLLENAVDALASEGSLQLRVRGVDADVAFEVDDDGPGFATGVFERALEPYFTTRQGRMGIGLNIARRIAARWEGKLELAPRERGVHAAVIVRVAS
jgi:signal transduction histidine kinase